MSLCGNCSYNCCCYCENRKNCRICKKKCVDNGENYPLHHLCLTCKHTWKTREGSVVFNQKRRIVNNGYMHDKRNIKDRQIYAEDEMYNRMKPIACPLCRKTGIMIGRNYRVPKQSDYKGWKLLDKLINCSYNDLQNMESDKNEKFIYLFYSWCTGFYDEESSRRVRFHDYEQRWMSTNDPTSGRPKAILFEDDHIPKYYLYPTKLHEYPQFLAEVKNERKYFFNASERWKMLKLYIKSISIINYWKKYASSKNLIKYMLGFEPEYNILRHFEEFSTLMSLQQKVSIPKDVLFLISKYLFFK